MADEKQVNDLASCNTQRILIVDDERMIREVFCTILSYGLSGYEFDVAENGAEAVQMFRETRQSVILMDLRMPIMDGETAFEEISKVCEEDKIEMPSVIFCTGYLPSDSLQEEVDKSGNHCILRKPVSNEILVETIKSRLP